MSTADKSRPLLIVEDDPALQKQMRWAFDQYETLLADRPRRSDGACAPAGAAGGDDGPGAAARSRFRIGRIQAPRRAAGDRRRHQGHRAHGPARPRERAARDRCRRLRFLRQAVRARSSAADDRPRFSPARPADGESPAAERAPAGCIRQRGHARSRDAAHLPRHREGGGDQRHGAAAGRKRHRQGAARARAARAVATARCALRRDQLRGDTGEPARKRAVRLREGRVHRRRQADARAASRRRTTAR